MAAGGGGARDGLGRGAIPAAEPVYAAPVIGRPEGRRAAAEAAGMPM